MITAEWDCATCPHCGARENEEHYRDDCEEEEMISGDNFSHARPMLERALVERVRDEAQVLIAGDGLPSCADLFASGRRMHGLTEGEAYAHATICGAALALGMTPLELLEACGAVW